MEVLDDSTPTLVALSALRSSDRGMRYLCQRHWRQHLTANAHMQETDARLQATVANELGTMPLQHLCAAEGCAFRRTILAMELLDNSTPTQVVLRARESGDRGVRYLCQHHWREHLTANAHMQEAAARLQATVARRAAAAAATAATVAANSAPPTPATNAKQQRLLQNSQRQLPTSARSQPQPLELRTEAQLLLLEAEFEATRNALAWVDISAETSYPTTARNATGALVVPEWPPAPSPGPDDYPQVGTHNTL